MTKRQLIDQIVTLNQTAEPEFLAPFQDDELRNYLERLNAARKPRLAGDGRRYDKYFPVRQASAAEPGGVEQAVSTETDAAERAALLAGEPPAESTIPEAADTGPADERGPAKEEETDLTDDGGRTPYGLAEERSSDEGPTTRRESLVARAARPWRAPPADDDAEPQELDISQDAADPLDGSEEEELVDDAPSEDSAAAEVTEELAASAKPAPRGGDEDDSQSWLF